MKSLETIEKLLHSYKQKEMQLIQQLNEENIKAENALLNKERIEKMYEKSLHEIERLNKKMENLKNENNKEIDNITHKMNGKYQAMESNLQEELYKLSENNTKTQNEKNQMKRKLMTMESEMTAFQNMHTNKMEQLTDEINKLSAQITELNTEKIRSEEK